MDTGGRPLSPHLQVYKPQLTSVLSILHRISGIALAVGTVLLVWWLVAASTGVDAFNTVQRGIGAWIGRLCLLGWSFALFYHLCNGIRHLFWDMGQGFELETAYKFGWGVVVVSIALTLIAWIWGYSIMGTL